MDDGVLRVTEPTTQRAPARAQLSILRCNETFIKPLQLTKMFGRESYVVSGEKARVVSVSVEMCVGHIDDLLAGGCIRILGQRVKSTPAYKAVRVPREFMS